MERILSLVLSALTSSGVPAATTTPHPTPDAGEVQGRWMVTESGLDAKSPYLESSDHGGVIGGEKIEAVGINGKPVQLHRIIGARESLRDGWLSTCRIG